MTKYRVAIGLDLSTWTSAHDEKLLGCVLTEAEAETWTKTRATAIFYTMQPSRVMMELLKEGFTISDFNWINVSKE